MAIGLETLKKMNDALPEGLQTHLVPQEHRFRSVHGTSKTTYVAVIPTSLGNRGSLLRPAVFESKESRTAPFLISLPFLLHCQAVLHLDPSKGLRIHFKKFGFTVKCHLGPTGALRVPLSQFTEENLSCVMQAQEQLKAHHQEFEVLKTTIENREHSGPREPGLDCPDLCDQPGSNGRERRVTCVDCGKILLKEKVEKSESENEPVTKSKPFTSQDLDEYAEFQEFQEFRRWQKGKSAGASSSKK